jgi:hypothetical protein
MGITMGTGHITHYDGIYRIGDPNSATGTNNVVIFDNQTIGINLNSMDAIINNCTFQNTRTANHDPETYGILAYHYDEETHYITTTAPAGTPHNAFFDCKHAITANFFTNTVLDDNDIRSSKTEAPGSVDDGLEGITVRASSYGWDNGYDNTVFARHNNIANIANGITLQFDESPWYYGAPPPVGISAFLGNTIDINNNHISSGNDLGFGTNTAFFCEQAINMEVVALTYVYGTTVPPLRCNGNVINLVSNGIRLSNWDGKDLRVLNNHISLNNDPSNPSTFVRGIVLDGCLPQNSMANFIYANEVTNTVNDATKFTSGLYVSNGNNLTIRCNSTSGLQGHHLYNSDLQPTNFFNNDMNSFIGIPPLLVITAFNNGLLLNAGGTIGTQGNSGAASDNKWPSPNAHFWGASIGNYKTFAANSNVLASPLYVQQAQPSYDPSDVPPAVYNSFGGGALYPYDFGNSSLVNGAAGNYTCPTITGRLGTVTVGEVEYIYIIDDPELHEPISEEGIPVDNGEGRQLAAAEQLALGHGANSNLSEPLLRQYVAQLELYHTLQQPGNQWQARSSILQQFATNGKNSAFGLIDSISRNIALNKLALAGQQLSNWQPANRVEENYAKFFNWTILRHQQQSINLAEVEILAKQCPQTDGNMVFAAQNLYNALTNQHRLFINNCDYKPGDTQNRQAVPKTAIAAVLAEANLINVYPNPASTMVNISGNNIIKVELLDMYGKLLAAVNGNSSPVSITLNKLSSGMYLLRITDNRQKVTTKRFFKGLQ